jgi:hypothetical protein
MSVKDMWDSISNAFKRVVDNQVGTNLALMAEYISGVKHLYPNTVPQAGPLLLVSTNRQRVPVDSTVTISYKAAELSGVLTTTFNDTTYSYNVYKDRTKDYRQFLKSNTITHGNVPYVTGQTVSGETGVTTYSSISGGACSGIWYPAQDISSTGTYYWCYDIYRPDYTGLIDLILARASGLTIYPEYIITYLTPGRWVNGAVASGAVALHLVSGLSIYEKERWYSIIHEWDRSNDLVNIYINNTGIATYTVSGLNADMWGMGIFLNDSVGDLSIKRVYQGTDREIAFSDYVNSIEIFTTGITIPKNSRDGYQVLFQHSGYANHSGYVTEITDISIDEDKTHTWLYSLASKNTRLLYGMNNEYNRDIIEEYQRMYFLHGPQCILCNGSGYLQNNTSLECPDCSGYGWVGRMASGYYLDLRAKDYGLKHGNIGRDHFHILTWAQKWCRLPTLNNVRNYLSRLLNVDEDFIDFEYTYTTGGKYPETYYTVLFPNNEEIIGTRIPLNADYIEDLAEIIAPAGVGVVAEGYSILLDSYYIIPTGTGDISGNQIVWNMLHTDSDIFIEEYLTDGFCFNGQLNEKFFTNPTHYTGNSYSLQTGFYYYYSGAGTGIEVTGHYSMWSGGTEIDISTSTGWVTGYWTGIESVEEYKDMIYYDYPFAEVQRSGDTGYTPITGDNRKVG